MLRSEQFPKLAIILPHPTQEDTSAVSVVTNTLPGVQIDELEPRQTWEHAARALAADVTADKDQSVNLAFNTAPMEGINFALYLMKPPKHTDIDTTKYRWQSHDEQTIRRTIARLIGPTAERVTQDRRKIIEEPNTKAMHIHFMRRLASEASERRSKEATRKRDDLLRMVQSYFMEEAGMYDLPLVSSLGK